MSEIHFLYVCRGQFKKYSHINNWKKCIDNLEKLCYNILNPESGVINVPEYYTTKEVADKFRVSMQAIRNMIDSGRLKAVKIGRAYRIPESEIQRIGTPSNSNQSDTAEPMPLKEESAQLPAEPTESRAAPLPDSWKK